MYGEFALSTLEMLPFSNDLPSVKRRASMMEDMAGNPKSVRNGSEKRG